MIVYRQVNGKGFSNVQEFSDLTAKKTSLLLEVLKATDLKTVVAGLQDSVQVRFAVVGHQAERYGTPLNDQSSHPVD